MKSNKDIKRVYEEYLNTFNATIESLKEQIAEGWIDPEQGKKYIDRQKDMLECIKQHERSATTGVITLRGFAEELIDHAMRLLLDEINHKPLCGLLRVRRTLRNTYNLINLANKYLNMIQEPIEIIP